ncbi:OLC1v1001816C1 [Oldenlandia corymbosa var. corymbosa]|uniref:OLC1v1001816C1 n=1 Tax=Oldenlandia corymbosa var. corymbosa TaxID=529605 RepID=A0AAV1D928_OLDCO|nr:OLC1v1001816C1 [Oldenlandia corymbosa var. corymbosa]
MKEGKDGVTKERDKKRISMVELILEKLGLEDELKEFEHYSHVIGRVSICPSCYSGYDRAIDFEWLSCQARHSWHSKCGDGWERTNPEAVRICFYCREQGVDRLGKI